MPRKKPVKGTDESWRGVRAAAEGAATARGREVTLSVRVPEPYRVALSRLAVDETEKRQHRVTIAMLTVEALGALLAKYHREAPAR